MRTPGTKSGYAVLELLFYIAFFALLSLVVINSMIAMAGSFRQASVYSELSRGGSVMERISREIRQAESINLIGANMLKLNTTDAGGTAMTVQFSLSGSDILFYENDALVGNLNASDLSVASLVFTEITTTEGKAIKVEMSMVSENDMSGRVAEFYNTVALRGAY